MLNINSYFKEGLAKVEQRSIKWLLSAEAATARCNRLTESGATHIVHVEVHGRMSNEYRFEELDADSLRHALFIAKCWLTKHGAASVAVRKVNDDGSLSSPLIYDLSDFEEDDQ